MGQSHKGRSMSEDQEAQVQSSPTTVWSQLDEWARGFKPWQRFVLSNAIRSGQLTDQQVDQAYSLFLHDNSLGDAPDPPIDIPATITGQPASSAPAPIWLKRITGLRAINALPVTAELNFSSALTVVYGGNGAGKSGFTRILSNVCFSRAQHPILPNVYDEKTSDVPRASIITADGMQREITYLFDGSTEHPQLKRIAVFDTFVAHRHLVEQNPLGFKLAGFDVFPEMARVYGQIGNHLAADIERRNIENTLPKSFVTPESPVSRFVTALSADTDRAELRQLAVFGEAETARLEEVQRQIKDLQSKSAIEAIKQLAEARRDIVVLQERLAENSSLLSEERRVGYRGQLATFANKAKVAAMHGVESFKQDNFKSIGTVAWENFLAAAYALAQVESRDYPRDHDHCLLCRQTLDADSAALIKRFWRFLASDVKREAEAARAQLEGTVQALKAIRLDFFSADTTVHAHLTRLDPVLTKRIEALIAAIEHHRATIVTVLENTAGDIASASLEDVYDALTVLIAQIDADVARLESLSVEDALSALETERITLRHRQVLQQLLPEAEKYVSDLAWVKEASGSPRRSLNPRPLTEKESELFATIIAKDYRERFASECKALDCNLPVEFRTQGQRGQTVRSLSIRGRHSPDRILSEGEQRAVALADFLTEIGLNPANAGIVLDDPVTSQDHQRKDRIAHRLVSEAKCRQVVVFTHDLVFLTMLVGAAENENVEILTHWIERDNQGRPGQISLDDCPANTPEYRKTQRAQKTLAEAKSVTGSVRVKLIQRGMAELRRTVEEIVPHYLLKEVVKRWTDRVIVTGLKKVNWDDGLIVDIVDTYEELSAFIEGHSHTEEQVGAPPELKHLENMISRVNDLTKRAKSERKS